MKTNSKRLKFVALLIMVMVGISHMAFSLPPAIDGAEKITIQPNTGSHIDQSHSFKFSGTFYYYLSNDTGPLHSYFKLIWGNTVLQPGTLYTLPITGELLTFVIGIPSGAQICTSEDVVLNFFRPNYSIIGGFSYKICCAEDDTRNQLLYLNSGAYYANKTKQISHDYWTSAGWQHEVINPVGGWGNVKAIGWLTGEYYDNKIFFYGSTGTQNNAIYSLYKSGSNWYLAKIKDLSSSSIYGLKVRKNGTDIFYGMSNGSINHLYYSNSVWNYEQILCDFRGSLELAKSTNHVFFSTLSNRVANLWGNTGNWHFDHLSVTAPNCGGDLIYDDLKGVYYKGEDKIIHRLNYNNSTGKWDYDPMTSTPNVSGNLAKFPGEDRVFYKGEDGRMYNLLTNGTVWWCSTLVSNYSGVGGDLICSEGKVFYITTSNTVANFYWTGTQWWYGNLTSNQDAKGCSASYRSMAIPEDDNSENTDENVFFESSKTIGYCNLFPNPASEKLFIDYVLTKDTEIKINLYSNTGALVKTLINNVFLYQGAQHHELDINTFDSGIYFIELEYDGNKETHKIIIE